MCNLKSRVVTCLGVGLLIPLGTLLSVSLGLGTCNAKADSITLIDSLGKKWDVDFTRTKEVAGKEVYSLDLFVNSTGKAVTEEAKIFDPTVPIVITFTEEDVSKVFAGGKAKPAAGGLNFNWRRQVFRNETGAAWAGFFEKLHEIGPTYSQKDFGTDEHPVFAHFHVVGRPNGGFSASPLDQVKSDSAESKAALSLIKGSKVENGKDEVIQNLGTHEIVLGIIPKLNPNGTRRVFQLEQFAMTNPEPNSLVLAGIALIVLLCYALLQRKAVAGRKQKWADAAKS
jgi:hypothetical protein